LNTFKKFAIRFAAVSAAFALAFSFMVSSPKEADGAALAVAASGGIDNVLTSSSLPGGVTLGTLAAGDALTTSHTLTLTFTAGTVINTANVAATDITVAQAASGGNTAGAATDCVTATADATNRTIVCALDAASLSTGGGANAGKGVVTVATHATMAGNEVIFPNTATTTGTWDIEPSNGDTGTDVTNVTVVAPSIALSVTSVKADSVSSANVTFGTSADVTSGGDTITVITDAGQFFIGDNADGNSDLLNNSTQWAPNPSVSAGTVFTNTLNATSDASDPDDTISIRSSSTGTGTIKVYITPKGGGTAVLVKQLSITFTAATATPLLTTVTLGTPSPSAIPGTGGTVSRLTINLKDQNGNAVANGKTVTVTTDEGVIDSNGTTCDTGTPATKTAGSDASCTFTWTGTQANASLWGIGNTGTATITVKATPFGTTTPVKSTKTVTLTGGSVSTLTLGLFNSTSSTSAPAAYVIKNVNDEAGADNTSDEIVAVAQAQDANGNYIIPAGNVTFALTNSSGSAYNNILANAVEDTTIQAGSACSVSVNTNTGKCVDTIEANAKLKKSGAIAILDVDKASTAPMPAGTYTVTATHGSGASKKTATATFTVGAAASAVTIADIASTTVGGTTSIVASATDAAGNSVADGTQITVSASSANLLLKTATGTTGSAVTVGSSNGSVTVTGIGLLAGNSQVVATTGTKVGSALSVVTGGDADGTLDKNIPAGGSGSVYWSGGSGIVAAASAGGCDALTIAGDNSSFSGKVVYVVNAAFDSVNADFNASYTIDSLAKGAYELTCKAAS
jgi:fibronectin-binding autotransporter adhesin